MTYTTQLMIAVIALLKLVSCGTPPEARQEPPARATRPLRVCVMQDLTGSILDTRTPRISEKELRRLLDIVKPRGGEVGLGAIQEQSDRGLTRLFVEDAPPEVPPPPANPLDMDRWREEAGKIEAQRRAWEAKLQARIEAFLTQAQARLQAPLARATDVCGAIRRCELMLGEPTDSPTANFVVLITDGQHNVRASACPEEMTSRVLLVNGAGVLGILGRYRPVRFESVDAAVNYIAKSASGGAATQTPSSAEKTKGSPTG